MREKIVPTAKRYPIEQLVDALDNHMKSYEENRQVRRRHPPLHEKAAGAGDNNGGSGSGSSKKEKEIQKRRAMIEYIMLVSVCLQTSPKEAVR